MLKSFIAKNNPDILDELQADLKKHDQQEKKKAKNYAL